MPQGIPYSLNLLKYSQKCIVEPAGEAHNNPKGILRFLCCVDGTGGIFKTIDLYKFKSDSNQIVGIHLWR